MKKPDGTRLDSHEPPQRQTRKRNCSLSHDHCADGREGQPRVRVYKVRDLCPINHNSRHLAAKFRCRLFKFNATFEFQSCAIKIVVSRAISLRSYFLSGLRLSISSHASGSIDRSFISYREAGEEVKWGAIIPNPRSARRRSGIRARRPRRSRRKSPSASAAIFSGPRSSARRIGGALA